MQGKSRLKQAAGRAEAENATRLSRHYPVSSLFVFCFSYSLQPNASSQLLPLTVPSGLARSGRRIHEFMAVAAVSRGLHDMAGGNRDKGRPPCSAPFDQEV